MSTGASEPGSAAAARVFITYRREETAAHAGRLYDAMVGRFGEANVFMDVDMAPGVDFVERITEAVAACHVLIVVMGPSWATVEDERGTARLADPEDFVRLEVETALRRPEVTPIPVLVAGARMPNRDDLPPELRAITRRNALDLSDQRWRYDVGRLISTLDELLSERPLATSPSPREHSVATGKAAPADAAQTARQTAAPSTIAATTPVDTTSAAPPPAGAGRLWRWALLGAVAIVAIVVAVVVSTGGGGGNEEEDQVTRVVETEATTTDPANCEKLHTQHYLEQAYFAGTGQAARDECDKQTRNSADDPDSVEVTDVQVSGNSATAEVRHTGGFFDGQTLVLSLRKVGDQWKLDQFDDIKDFNLQRFADAFAETPPPWLTQKQANCAQNQFTSMPAKEVKAGILSGELEQLLPFSADCHFSLP